MITRATSDLFLAATLRALGATTVGVAAGQDGKGEVTLDVSRVTAARSRDEGEALAEQFRQMASQPELEDVRHVMQNTFLRSVFDEYVELKRRVLQLKPGARR